MLQQSSKKLRGFAGAVTNHGVSNIVIQRQFAEARKFFSLPYEEKLEVEVRLWDTNVLSVGKVNAKQPRDAQADDKSRGYTPLAEQTLDPANQTRPDTKESYYIWGMLAVWKAAVFIKATTAVDLYYLFGSVADTRIYCAAPDVPKDSPEAQLPFHGPNQWPSDSSVPGFKPAMLEYLRSMSALASK